MTGKFEYAQINKSSLVLLHQNHAIARIEIICDIILL